MEALTKLLFDFDKLPSKLILCICLLSAMILFVPSEFLAKIKLHNFNETYGQWVGIAFLSSAGFLCVTLLTHIKNVYKKRIKKIEDRKALEHDIRNQYSDIREKFQQIDVIEQSILREFFIVGSTVNLPMDQPAVVGLQDKRIIRLAHSSTGQYIIHGNAELPFMLTYTARSIIETKPSLIGLPYTNKEQITDLQWKQIVNARPPWIRRNFRY